MLISTLSFTALFIAIGCIATTYSKNHRLISNAYQYRPTLWMKLGQTTITELEGLRFLPRQDTAHHFSNVRCPSETAVMVAGQYLHANQVGKGVSQRSFVASQAPLEADYETFWKAIFSK